MIDCRMIPEEYLWINPYLVRAALAEQKEMPGCSLAAQSGDAWASLKMTADQWAPMFGGAIKRLDEWVRSEISNHHGAAHIDWWFTVMGPTGAIAEHDHHMARISGIYYPESFLGQGGELLFTQRDMVFTPQEGLLLIFDPKEKHQVTPVHNIAPLLKRVSMSFNVM